LFSYHLTQIDTAAPTINCLIDTFIKAVGIQWNRNPFINRYELRINDELIVLGNQSSYLYSPKVKNELLNISLKAWSGRCFHHTAYAQCIGPEVVEVNEIGKETVKICPNPSSGIFKLVSDKRILEMEVFDFSGKRILKTNDQEIDLSTNESGIYFFKIRTRDQIFLKKVVKI